MASHSYHPDSHEFGLADNCERCEEHAVHPFQSLDDTNIRHLYHRVKEDLPARSINESIAMGKVREAMNVSRIIFDLESWEKFLAELQSGSEG